MGGGGGCFEDVYLTVLWCGCVWDDQGWCDNLKPCVTQHKFVLPPTFFLLSLSLSGL